MNPSRGSFPKSATPETPAERRTRYEAWIIKTHAPTTIDPAFDAVMEQPNHAIRTDPSKMPTRPSLKLAIRARCWGCVAGDDDGGGTSRIAECEARSCALWSVRPYKPKDEALPAPYAGEVERGDHALIALQKPGQRGAALRGYCHSCCGGKREENTMRAVSDCSISRCELWTVRPRLSTPAGIGCKGDVNAECEALEPSNDGEVVLP